MAGNYHSLFAPAETGTISGSINLALTSSGSFSGKVLLGADTLPFSGIFDPSGATRIVMARRGKNDLTATLQLDLGDQAVKGNVTDGAFVRQVTAYRNVFRSIDPARKYQETYAVIMPVTNCPAAGPGPGYGTISVDAAGNVSFGGILPDGTRVGQTNLDSPDGYWPFYRQLDWGSGSFWTWSEFTNSAAHWPIASANAGITWVRPTVRVQIIGSRHDAVNQQ
jgi:hypothetical protein